MCSKQIIHNLLSERKLYKTHTKCTKTKLCFQKFTSPKNHPPFLSSHAGLEPPKRDQVDDLSKHPRHAHIPPGNQSTGTWCVGRSHAHKQTKKWLQKSGDHLSQIKINLGGAGNHFGIEESLKLAKLWKCLRWQKLCSLNQWIHYNFLWYPRRTIPMKKS